MTPINPMQYRPPTRQKNYSTLTTTVAIINVIAWLVAGIVGGVAVLVLLDLPVGFWLWLKKREQQGRL